MYYEKLKKFSFVKKNIIFYYYYYLQCSLLLIIIILIKLINYLNRSKILFKILIKDQKIYQKYHPYNLNNIVQF